MIKLDSDMFPNIYAEKASTDLLNSALTKMGKTESLSLISEVYQEKLASYGDSILLDFVNQGFSNTVVVRVGVGSIIDNVFFPTKNYITKLGRYNAIKPEVDNYNQLIQPYGLDFVPELIAHRDTIKRWALILYSDLGTVTTFHDIYIREETYIKSREYINSLFNLIDNHWLKSSLISKTNLYTDQFGLMRNADRYQEANRVIVPTLYNRNTIPVKLGDTELHLNNPVWYLLQNAPYADIVTHIATVHGDLHSENILINESSSSVFLIDFANMQSDGHIFKDHVKFEANILFRLMDYTASKRTRNYKPEWLLLVGAILGYEVDIPGGHEITKALECIKAIRNRAYKLKKEELGSNDWENEYLVGLLHWTLLSVYWIDIFPAKKQLAFYTACLICDSFKKIKEEKHSLLK